MKSSIRKTWLQKSLIVKIVVQLVCVFIFTALVSTSAWSCEGEDYEETLNLIHSAIDAGYNLARTGDMRPLLELNDRLYALPPSCQRLVERISAGFRNRYNPNSTTCYGGVCCDSNGCTSS